jgi:hypothetical protein
MPAPPEPHPVGMTPGDARAWDAVQRWRTADPAGSGWWGRLDALALSGLRLLPGTGLVDDVVGGAVADPLREAGMWLGWLAAGRPEHVVAALADAGFAVEVPADLRRLDVDDLRALRASLVRLRVTAAGMRGGLTGAAVGAAAGATSAAAGVVAALAAAALDTVLSAAACTRAVARVAVHYGYDTAEPPERAFALAVLAAGLSPDPPRAVVGDLSGDAVRPDFGHHGACELARGVPGLGVGVGVVLSTRQIARVLETAEHLYTERFLHEKYGTPAVVGDLAAVAS